MSLYIITIHICRNNVQMAYPDFFFLPICGDIRDFQKYSETKYLNSIYVIIFQKKKN